jgi:8-oxo-dGTP diphosphatase
VPSISGPSPGRPAYRDASGRSLTDYPRPSVAVDTAVLTVAPRRHPAPDRPAHQLQVLLVSRPADTGQPAWSLPGTFLHEGERLAEAVARSLAEKAGINRGTRASQLQVFDQPDRDARGWVLSVAHLAALPHTDLQATLTARPARVRLARASRPGSLPYDHTAIVTAAVSELRRLYRRTPDPLRLLGASFTMSQLREVHEAVHGGLLQKDTFRRAMEPHLHTTDTLATGSVGRPSRVFSRRAG